MNLENGEEFRKKANKFLRSRKLPFSEKRMLEHLAEGFIFLDKDQWGWHGTRCLCPGCNNIQEEQKRWK